MSGRKLTAGESGRIQTNVAQITRGASISLDDLVRASPVVIPTGGVDQVRTLLKHVFRPDDCVEFVPATFKKPGQKASPAPHGTIIEVGRLDRVSDELTALLDHKIGTFLRINPVRRSPSGPIKATDITRFPHLLVEHDHVPKDVQAALLASLELPIAVIIDSGGKSLHAWVSANVKGSQLPNYRLAAVRIMSLLKPLGFDSSNSDASRLSRAPGFARTDNPESGATQQRLLYLNPKVRWDSPPIIEGIRAAKEAAAETANQSSKAEQPCHDDN